MTDWTGWMQTEGMEVVADPALPENVAVVRRSWDGQVLAHLRFAPGQVAVDQYRRARSVVPIREGTPARMAAAVRDWSPPRPAVTVRALQRPAVRHITMPHGHGRSYAAALAAAARKPRPVRTTWQEATADLVLYGESSLTTDRDPAGHIVQLGGDDLDESTRIGWTYPDHPREDTP